MVVLPHNNNINSNYTVIPKVRANKYFHLLLRNLYFPTRIETLSSDSRDFCLHVRKFEFWKFLQVTLYLSYTKMYLN